MTLVHAKPSVNTTFGMRHRAAAWMVRAGRIAVIATTLTHLPTFGERTSIQPGTSMASSSFSTSGPQASLDQAIAADDPVAIAQAVSAGAQVNARGPKDTTPLMVAVDRQKLRAVQALLQAGADTKPVAIDGASAVSLAVENYSLKPVGGAIMQALFKAGGDPNTIRPNSDPVIMKFVRAHDCDALRLMKSYGANLDIRDRTNDPIITKAALAMNWDVVWCLMELGARFDYENGDARQPLSKSLANDAPSRSSPIFPYKEKVWQRLHDKGVALKPLVGWVRIKYCDEHSRAKGMSTLSARTAASDWQKYHRNRCSLTESRPSPTPALGLVRAELTLQTRFRIAPRSVGRRRAIVRFTATMCSGYAWIMLPLRR